MDWTEAIRRIFNKHRFEEDACHEMWQFIDHIEQGGDVNDWFSNESEEEETPKIEQSEPTGNYGDF